MLGEVGGPKFEPTSSTRRGEAQTNLTSKPQDVTAVRMPPVRRLISRVFLSLWTLHARMRAASSTARLNQGSHARLAREHPDASISLIFPVLRVLAQALRFTGMFGLALAMCGMPNRSYRQNCWNCQTYWHCPEVPGQLELQECWNCGKAGTRPCAVLSEFEKARMSAEAEDKKKQPRKGWTRCHKTHVESDSVDSVTQGGCVLARNEGT